MKTSITFLTALLISSLSFGQDITQRIDSIIRESYVKNPEVGISVGFIADKKEFYTAYGKLNAGSETPIDKNSLFEIASITKIVTSN
ncbi:MAG: serine hydrolase, partial [Chryseobacterium sp.]